MRIPRSVKESIPLDKSNGNKIWWEAILQEMKHVRIDFKLYEGSAIDLPLGYQEVSCHILFDVNMGDNFHHKPRMVSGGHNTTRPYSLKYFSVLSRDIVRIYFKSYALNHSKVIACNIHIAYLPEK